MQNLGINCVIRITTDGHLPTLVLDDLVAAVNDVLHEHLRSTDINYDTEVRREP